MSKNINVPKLRFKEFTKGWEEKKLFSLSENGFSNGAFNDPKKVGSGYKIINVKDMYIDGVINTDTLTRVALDEKEFLKNRVEYGDIFFTRSSLVKEGIAYSNISLSTDKDLTFDGHLIRMRPKKGICFPIFLYYTFTTKKVRNQFIVRGKTTTMTTIGQDDIASVNIFLPLKQEQEKIALFLSSVDTKIEQLIKKEKLLQQYKKSIMQKIFSQEIRFKDDDRNEFPEWKEKKLGQIGITYNGLTNKNKENFGFGKPYIQYKQIFDNNKININKFELVEILENENQNRVLFGDVFFTVSSETPNEIGMSAVLLDEIEELYLNSFCFGFRVNSLKELSPYYARYFFRSEIFRKNITKLAQGSTRYNMSKLELLKLKIKLPCLEEQKKIANFLSSIDDKIEENQKILEKTKEFKKSLLQQMFV